MKRKKNGDDYLTFVRALIPTEQQQRTPPSESTSH
jgi:hypothetical protein